MLKLFRGMPFTVEVKYDGLRAQIHRLSDGSYKIFSRHLMDQKDRWADLEPCITNAIRQPEQTTSFIIDAEIVAIEYPNTAASASAAAADAAAPPYRILPFQQLSTRKRAGKSDNPDASIRKSGDRREEVTCMVYCFDFLSLNGESLLLRSLPARRALMAATFRESIGELQFVEHCDISAEAASAITAEELEEEEAESKPTKKNHALAAKKAAAPAAASRDELDESNYSDVEALDDEPVELLPTVLEESKEDDAAAAAAASTADAAVSAVDSSTAIVPAATVANGLTATEQILQFLHSTALPRGEGVMAKSLSARSTYEPDVRTNQWCSAHTPHPLLVSFALFPSAHFILF